MEVAKLALGILALAVSSGAIDLRVDPMVLIDQGVVRGEWSNDASFASFKGIPYALVNPENPFGDSLPGPKIDGIFDANIDNIICPQISPATNEPAGTLDCLIANVYVPKSAGSSNRLPVMVWLHGGGFRTGGSGTYYYGPQYLVRHDVILVTLNYRLGPYGFMCLDTPQVPGNSGIKDQRKGLQWVKENIAAFGGDSSSITVFGQSAGGMSLEYHILFPNRSDTNELFNRAILQSGSALVEQVLIESRPSAPIELTQYLGFETETIEEALQILKEIPTDDVIAVTSASGISFKPCVEKDLEGVERFVTDFPDNVLESGDYYNIPIMIGYTEFEQLNLYFNPANGEEFFNGVKNIFYNRINGSFDFETEEELQFASNLVKEFYVGTNPIGRDAIWELIGFDSDAHFVNPIERSIKYRINTSELPVYQYMFTYSGEINFNKYLYNITEDGASHSDDLAYLFTQSYLTNDINDEDKLLIDRMTTMWTNFAKYGNPTPAVTDLLPVTWPAVSEDRLVLRIDSELTIVPMPLHNRTAFWDLLFQAYGDKFRNFWSSTQTWF